MKKKVFISKAKSSLRGGFTAILIKNHLNNYFSNHVDVFVSEEMEAGADWNNKIRKAANCDYFIALLDEAYVSSQWCNFEAGCFIGEKSDSDLEGKLYAIEVDDYWSITVFDRYQKRKFDNSTFEAFAGKILSDNNVVAASKDYKLHSTEITNLVEAFNRERDTIEATNENIENFYKGVDSNIQKVGASNGLDRNAIEVYKEYWMYAATPFITSQLRDIGNALKQSERHNLSDKGKWRNIWKDMAIKQVASLCTNLNKISARTINIFDTHHITDFWIQEIMTRVSTSIWTTNLPGTNGRKNKRAFIDAQKEAIDRKVVIIRVFVFSIENSQDCEQLKTVIKEQIEAGIKVYVITQENFNKSIDNSVHETSTLDFMIIDNKYVYKTIIDKDSRFIKELKFEDDERELGRLNNIKKQIEQDWKQIISMDDFTAYLDLFNSPH